MSTRDKLINVPAVGPELLDLKLFSGIIIAFMTKKSTQN